MKLLDKTEKQGKSKILFALVGILLLGIVIGTFVLLDNSKKSDIYYDFMKDDLDIESQVNPFMKGENLIINYKNPNNELVWIEGLPPEKYLISEKKVIVYNYNPAREFRLHIGEESDIYDFLDPKKSVEEKCNSIDPVACEKTIIWNITQTEEEMALDVDYEFIDDKTTKFCIKEKESEKYTYEDKTKDLSKVPIKEEKGLLERSKLTIDKEIDLKNVEKEKCFEVSYEELVEEMIFKIGWNTITIETVESSFSFGYYPSIGLTSSGEVYISHYSSTSSYLRACNGTLGDWTCDSPTGITGSVGLYTSLAIDSTDEAHIIHMNDTFNTIDHCEGVYGDWQCESIEDLFADPTSWITIGNIAINSTDGLWVAYENGTSSKNLRVCYGDFGNWNCEDIYSLGNDDGKGPSIAIDSNDIVHIVSYNDTGTSIDYCNNSGGTWGCETIETINDPEENSIWIDDNDITHIAYYESGFGDLEYCNGTSGDWDCGTIESTDNVGNTPSIVVNESGERIIVHEDTTNTDARLCQSLPGESWSCKFLGVNSALSSNYIGRKLAIKNGVIATSSTYSNAVHLAWFYNPSDDLLYVKDTLIDTEAPQVTWEDPTPADGDTLSQNYVYLNTTITDESSDTSAWFDFNGDLLVYYSIDYFNTTGIFDNSTYGQFGEFVGGVDTDNITTGARGSSVQFDGTTGSYIDAPISSELNQSIHNSNLTISFWARVEDLSQSDQTFLNIVVDGSNRQYIRRASTSGEMRVWQVIDSNSNGDSTASNYITDTDWHHYIWKIEGRNNTIYIDGFYNESLILTYSINGMIGTPLIRMAALDGSTFPLDGALDEVMFFNRSLSDQEIKALYSNAVNRLYNNYINLGIGTYNYSAYAIDDSGNLNITDSRDVTLSEAGDNPPVVTLNEPTDNTDYTFDQSVIFNCTAYDAVNLTNVTFYWNVSGTFIANGTNTSGINNSKYQFERDVNTFGEFVWNCKGTDNSSNTAFASSNRSFSLHKEEIIISDPVTGSPVSVSSGDNITIKFNWSRDGVNQTTGVSMENVTIGGSNAPLLGSSVVGAEIDFETFGTDLGDWYTYYEVSSQCVWEQDTDGTTSSGTGPCAGASNCATDDAGYDDNFYAYVETSVSDCSSGTGHAFLQLNDTNMDTYGNINFTFAYNMYGAEIGNLSLQIDDGVGGWDTLWWKDGDQGTDWYVVGVDMSSYSGTRDIRFNYDRAGHTSYTGDVAIDVLNVTNLAVDTLEFGYVNGNWEVNVSVPDFVTGLKDLMVNATHNSVNRQSTETNAVNYGGVDTNQVNWTKIPSNATIDYLDPWAGGDFDAIDKYDNVSYSVNDTTRFNINATGWLSMAYDLEAGTHSVLVTASDNSTNTNVSHYLLTINQDSSVCGIYFNESSPIVYPQQFEVYTNCSSAYTLYVNGTSISNASLIDGANYYNLSVQRTDTSNYSHTYMEQPFTISKNSGECEIYFNETSPITFPSLFRTWYNCGEAPTFTMNGSAISNNSVVNSGAGYYHFSVTRESENYTNYLDNKYFTVDQSGTACNLFFNETSPHSNATSFYASSSCASGYSVYRNGTFIGSHTFIHQYPLNAGYYNYSIFRNDTINYSVIYEDEWFNVTAFLNSATLTLSPSNSETYGTETTATCSAQQGTPKLYRDGSLVSSPDIHTFGVGTYDYVCNVSATGDYPAASDSDTLTITKKDPESGMDIDGTTPIIYPTLSNFDGDETNTGDGGCSYSLDRSNRIYGVGTWLFTYSTSGCANYTSGDVTRNLVVNQNTTYVLFITGTTPITYGTTTDVVGSGCPSELTCSLDKANGIYPVGTETFNYSTPGNTNYSVKYITKDIVINNGSLVASITNDRENTFIYDGSPASIGISESNPGDADVTYVLWKDGVSVGVADSETEIGVYIYIVNSTGGANYSSSASLAFLTLTIQDSPYDDLTVNIARIIQALIVLAAAIIILLYVRSLYEDERTLAEVIKVSLLIGLFAFILVLLMPIMVSYIASLIN